MRVGLRGHARIGHGRVQHNLVRAPILDPQDLTHAGSAPFFVTISSRAGVIQQRGFSAASPGGGGVVESISETVSSSSL